MITSVLNYFLQSAHSAPSADNSQPHRFLWDAKKTLRVCYDELRVRNMTFPADNPATILTMGALLENIVQAGAAINCPLKFRIPSGVNSSSDAYFEVDIDMESENVQLNFDLPLFKRHTNRLPFQSQPLPSELLSRIGDLKLSSAHAVVIDKASVITKVARLVKASSEIRFRTREVHEWLGKSLRFDDAHSNFDGLDVNTLDLPLGGKAFLRLISDWSRMKILNQVGAYKILAAIDASPIDKAPALIGIVAPSGFQDILYAGQLMNRIWIELNAQGIAVQPYYVISDQLHRRASGLIPEGLEVQAGTLFDETNKVFQLQAGDFLQMLFRIGYPVKSPVLSKRLPLADVCSFSIN